METKQKESSKKGMGAFRLPQDVLDNVKEVSSETGIPASNIVEQCLSKERVVEVVRKQLEGALDKFNKLTN